MMFQRIFSRRSSEWKFFTTEWGMLIAEHTPSFDVTNKPPLIIASIMRYAVEQQPGIYLKGKMDTPPCNPGNDTKTYSA